MRVPLDFEWPKGETWQGYINPYGESSVECEACEGTGYAAEALLWSKRWYGNAPFSPEMTGSKPFSPHDPTIQEINRAKLLRIEEVFPGSTDEMLKLFRATDFEQLVRLESIRMCRIWNGSWSNHLGQDDVAALFEEGRFHLRSGFGDTCPLAYEVNWQYLTGWGHDAINQSICVQARVERNGGTVTCPECDGDGVVWPSAEAKKQYDEWQPYEPPEGEGWQVWSTVSDSPYSPVFATSDELENWLIHEEGYSEGAAEQFVKVGHVFTMVMTGEGKIYKDIEALDVAQQGDEDE